MARKPELKQRFNTMVTLEFEDYQAFIKMIGEGNFSNEIRAYVKDRVSLQKNEEAQREECDPLSLKATLKSSSIKERQSTLFEDFSSSFSKDEIRKSIEKIDNPKVLGELASKGRCIWKVAETRQYYLTHPNMPR